MDCVILFSSQINKKLSHSQEFHNMKIVSLELFNRIHLTISYQILYCDIMISWSECNDINFNLLNCFTLNFMIFLLSDKTRIFKIFLFFK